MNKILITISIIEIFFTKNEAIPSPFFSGSDFVDVRKAVKYLNSNSHKTWTAGSNGFGRFLSSSEMRFRTGATPPNHGTAVGSTNTGNSDTPTIARPESPEDVSPSHKLPDYYDARTMYPYCTTISSIKDQSNCGSCWAVSTAAVFSDRLCISSRGLINVNISSNYLLSCVPEYGERGCEGNSARNAWTYIVKHGAVTGGDYGTFDGCQPYEIAPCGGRDLFNCQKVLTPKCRRKTCTNEYYESSHENQLYTVGRSLWCAFNETHPCPEEQIRQEIYLNGPVVAAFAIYRPFFFYKNGVFQIHGSTEDLKIEVWHLVRIIGWGVENGIPYWLAANSWSRRWGDNGTFKILRGKNHCFIESYISYGDPVLPPHILEQLGQDL